MTMAGALPGQSPMADQHIKKRRFDTTFALHPVIWGILLV